MGLVFRITYEKYVHKIEGIDDVSVVNDQELKVLSSINKENRILTEFYLQYYNAIKPILQ